MAKKANLFAVKVLDDQGAGAISGIISGLDLVAQRVANQTNSNSTTTTTNGTNALTPTFQSVGKRAVVANQTANANNFTLLNQLPNSLNVTSPISNPETTTPPNTDPNANTTTTITTPNTTNTPPATTTTTPDMTTPNTTTPNTTTPNTTTANRAVVNMSLGGDSHSNALDAAVQSLIAQGVVVVIAAGNAGTQIGTSSPADVAQAISVGAMDVHDNVPNFSDFGYVHSLYSYHKFFH
jgi:hypothetical protein